LGLSGGDGIQWEIEDGKVVVKKLSRIDLEWQKND
jgi:hypothetical protein